MTKQAVVEDVRGFYCHGFNESRLTYDEQSYAREVINLDNKSRYRAPVKWLVKSDAIAEQQMEILERLYTHRKDIAHELAKYLVDVDFEPDIELFGQALVVLRDIRKFWTQIEIDIGSFEGHGEVTVDEVTPLSPPGKSLTVISETHGRLAVPGMTSA